MTLRWYAACILAAELAMACAVQAGMELAAMSDIAWAVAALVTGLSMAAALYLLRRAGLI